MAAAPAGSSSTPAADSATAAAAGDSKISAEDAPKSTANKRPASQELKPPKPKRQRKRKKSGLSKKEIDSRSERRSTVARSLNALKAEFGDEYLLLTRNGGSVEVHAEHFGKGFLAQYYAKSLPDLEACGRAYFSNGQSGCGSTWTEVVSGGWQEVEGFRFLLLVVWRCSLTSARSRICC